VCKSKYREQFQEKLATARVKRACRLSAEQNHRCAYCGCKTWNRLDFNIRKPWMTKNNRATIEHVHCQTNGGKWGWPNTVMACHGCNNRRGSAMPAMNFFEMVKTPELWVKYRRKIQTQKSQRDAKRKKNSEMRRAAWLARGGHKVEMYA